ncbi:MAG: hypothetical protein PHW13_08175 [Methylococcales bacterium]|nr:hypothetical protein [Methylococcales bacterium]
MRTEQTPGKLVDPDKIMIKEGKFGIKAANALGIYQRDLKDLAKDIGRNNNLVIELFETGIYEAGLLCSKLYDPASILAEQMNQCWVTGFRFSWSFTWNRHCQTVQRWMF